MGESKQGCLRVDFDRRLKLEFHGSKVTSDVGLLAYRELDDALGLTEVAGELFKDSRTGKNGWHGMTGLFRQSVFGRLGGYDDVNDADRLGRDPAVRWIVGGKAAFGEKPVLKLMFGAMTRAAERWKPIKITAFEQRQMEAVKKELDHEYEAYNGLAKQSSEEATADKLSSRNRT